jgi:hypothetical protein
MPWLTAAADGGNRAVYRLRKQMARTCRPAMHRPGSRPNNEHLVEYPVRPPQSCYPLSSATFKPHELVRDEKVTGTG